MADIDRGWAWVVLGASIFNLTILGAMTVSIGMFQTEFLNHFEGSTAHSSLVGSLCAGLQSLLGPVAGVMCNIWGIRVVVISGAALLSIGLASASFATSLTQLVVSYGLLAGIGFGIVYTPAITAVGHYFQKKRVLTNGIALSSTGIGMMAGPHLIGWIIDQYGWRAALIVFGSVVTQITVSGSLMFPVNREKRQRSGIIDRPNDQTDDIKNATKNSRFTGSIFCLCCRNQNRCFCRNSLTRGMFTVLENKMLWILCLHTFLEMMGYSVQVVHFPSYVLSVGVSHTKVPSLFTAYGVSITLARLLGGVVCNHEKVNRILAYTIGQVLLGLVILLMPFFAHGFSELIVYQVLFGLCYGGTFILLTPIVVQLFGVESLAAVFGLLLFVGGISYFIGPTVAGALYDVSSSYSVGFHIGGGMVLLGAVTLIPIPVLLTMKTRRKRQQSEVEKMEAEECLVVEKTDNTGTTGTSA